MKFLLGFGIGIGLALLFAPAAGKETRDQLAGKMRNLARMPERKLDEAAEVAKEKAGELGSRVGREAAEAAVESIREDVLGKNKSA
jgi:gas vesicle protein